MLKQIQYLCLVLAMAACASGGAAGSTSDTGRSPAVHRDRNVITVDELADPNLTALSVYDAISTLRPNFFANRGSQSVSDQDSGRVHASVDGGGIVSVEELKRLHVNGVVEIRFLDAGAAMQKFGSMARQGPVIVVRSM